ncbi:MAG: hypothetical protein HQM16_12180 [Deltaproteobacteria bacterium]|nr:hypothetical protein [Deltaproteobacteria bacterium]
MREYWEFMGRVALYCFIIANVYFPASVISRRLLKNVPAAKTALAFYLKIEIAFNLIGLIAAFFHGHYAEERNVILQAAFLMIICMTIIGTLLYMRFYHEEQKHLRLLRIQQYLFLTCIAFLILGHALL